MRTWKRLFAASAVLLAGSDRCWSDEAPPAPAPASAPQTAAAAAAPPSAGKRAPETERETMAASMKNFALLLAASPDVKEIPNSAYPTHDIAWYETSLSALQKRVGDAAHPDVAAIDAFSKEYDALKQAFLDQVYDACPACYNRDKRIAVRAMQLKLDEAVTIDQRRQERLTPAQSARLDRISARLESMNRFELREIKDALHMTSAPRTGVPTAGGERTFRDMLRQAPVLPTDGPRAAVNVPPPPIDGDWHPNKWVSRANWADYKKLVPWLTTVLKETGTYDLMQSYGIKPVEYALALISTESSFFHGSQSTIVNRATGAVTHAYGFMQLLHGTASAMLADNRQAYESLMARDRASYAALAPAQRQADQSPQAVLNARQLNGATLKTNWKTNVFLGVAYLKQNLSELAGRLQGEGITSPSEMGPLLQGLVAASYNAGEGAVLRYWRRLDIARDDPNQSIVPYRETRKYVRQINSMAAMDWTKAGT